MWSKVKQSLVINLVLWVLVFVMAYSAFNAIQNAFILSNEAKNSEKKIQELLHKKKDLEERLAALGNKDVIMREAKARLNLKEAGEEVVVIVPPKKPAPTENNKLNVWQRIYKTFCIKTFLLQFQHFGCAAFTAR